MTGIPSAAALRVTIFCTCGTCSSGSSSPRSPRATMTASASARIFSRASTASGRSSLATSGKWGAPASRSFWRASVRSAALRTKLNATRSTPARTPKSRSTRSFGVSPPDGNRTPGALMPLCSPSIPPNTTVVRMPDASVSSTRSCNLPSSSSRVSPGCTADGRST